MTRRRPESGPRRSTRGGALARRHNPSNTTLALTGPRPGRARKYDHIERAQRSTEPYHQKAEGITRCGPAGRPDQASALVSSGIRSSFEQARAHYADGCTHLVDPYNGQAWIALDLPDWAAFVRHSLDVDHLRTPKAERKAIVEPLSEGGLSIRDIAAATGIGRSTVQRELSPPVPNGTPDAGEEQPSPVPNGTPTGVVGDTVPPPVEEATERLEQRARVWGNFGAILMRDFGFDATQVVIQGLAMMAEVDLGDVDPWLRNQLTDPTP